MVLFSTLKFLKFNFYLLYTIEWHHWGMSYESCCIITSCFTEMLQLVNPSCKEWESHFLGRLIGNLGVPKERGVWNSQGGRKDKLFTVFVDQDLGTGVYEIEGVTGRKARGLQMEEIACKCQTFFSLLSSRRKQTSNIFFPSLYKFKGRFLLKYCVAIMTPGFSWS